MVGTQTANSSGVKLETDGVFRAWTRIDLGQFGATTLTSTTLSYTVSGADGYLFRNTMSHTATAGTYYGVRFQNNIAPTSGTGIFNLLDIVSTINQTGGANGITRGLYINPTLTSAADFRAIETTTGSVLFNGGNVGIGTGTPSYLLDVNGTARVTTLIETSAAKYKTNIQHLDSQLSKVTQLEPVTFDWINKPNPKTNIGLIADEVEKIYPEFVSKTEDGEIEGIEYSKLTTVLIQSIKELKEIVDKQQEQINTLLNK
jgi:hypothetical protein